MPQLTSDGFFTLCETVGTAPQGKYTWVNSAGDPTAKRTPLEEAIDKIESLVPPEIDTDSIVTILLALLKYLGANIEKVVEFLAAIGLTLPDWVVQVLKIIIAILTGEDEDTGPVITQPGLQ